MAADKKLAPLLAAERARIESLAAADAASSADASTAAATATTSSTAATEHGTDSGAPDGSGGAGSHTSGREGEPLANGRMLTDDTAPDAADDIASAPSAVGMDVTG